MGAIVKIILLKVENFPIFYQEFPLIFHSKIPSTHNLHFNNNLLALLLKALNPEQLVLFCGKH